MAKFVSINKTYIIELSKFSLQQVCGGYTCGSISLFIYIMIARLPAAESQANMESEISFPVSLLQLAKEGKQVEIKKRINELSIDQLRNLIHILKSAANWARRADAISPATHTTINTLIDEMRVAIAHIRAVEIMNKMQDAASLRESRIIALTRLQELPPEETEYMLSAMQEKKRGLPQDDTAHIWDKMRMILIGVLPSSRETLMHPGLRVRQLHAPAMLMPNQRHCNQLSGDVTA